MVSDVKFGAVNCEIDIELAGGDKIAAAVINERVKVLGLRKA